MGIVFAIFMIFFGLAAVYTATIETDNDSGDPMYFLTFGLFCLAIAFTSLILSRKLYHYRKVDRKKRN